MIFNEDKFPYSALFETNTNTSESDSVSVPILVPMPSNTIDTTPLTISDSLSHWSLLLLHLHLLHNSLSPQLFQTQILLPLNNLTHLPPQ